MSAVPGEGDFAVITFENTHSAMLAQRLLAGSVEALVMPVPRALSASCGIALRMDPAHLAAAQKILGRGLSQGGFHCYLFDDGHPLPLC